MHLRYFADISGCSQRIVALALNIHSLAEERELLALHLRVIDSSLAGLLLDFGTLLASAIELGCLEGRKFLFLVIIDSILHEFVVFSHSRPDRS